MHQSIPPFSSQSIVSSMGPPTTQAAEQRRLREATAQTTVKHKKLLTNVQALHTSLQGAGWCHADDHVIIQGMKSRKDWRD